MPFNIALGVRAIINSYETDNTKLKAIRYKAERQTESADRALQLQKEQYEKSRAVFLKSEGKLCHSESH